MGEILNRSLKKAFWISISINLIFFCIACATLLRFRHALWLKLFPEKDLPVKVAIYGDSRVKFYNVDWIKGLNRRDVRNCGIGSTTTANLVDSIDKFVVKHNPRICLIQAGINDIRSGVKIDTILTNFIRLVDKLSAAKINVVVMSTIPVRKDPFQDNVDEKIINLWVDSLNENLIKLSAKHGFAYLDVNKNLIDGKRLSVRNTLDGVHLSDEGLQVLYLAVGAYLKEKVF